MGPFEGHSGFSNGIFDNLKINSNIQGHCTQTLHSNAPVMNFYATPIDA